MCDDFEATLEPSRNSVIISCAANEFHQIGGKMVADVFELNGWDAHFLGANTPVDHMLEHIQETQPELVGLSLSVYFNIASLKSCIETIKANFTHLDIVVGGQAFRWENGQMLKRYSRTELIPSLDDLETAIKGK